MMQHLINAGAEEEARQIVGTWPHEIQKMYYSYNKPNTNTLAELEETYKSLRDNNEFKTEFFRDLSQFVGRPSPLYFAKILTDHFGKASIWLKREDLNHTGAHKINNTVGQILLAKHMGKKRIIAETGAGQHGVATATVAARLGLECHIYLSLIHISEPTRPY